jgi:hypothetical protein
MKALLPIVLLFSLSILGASTTVMIQGNSSSGHYALELKSSALSISLSSNGTVNHSTVTLPLGGTWTLVAREGAAKVHYPSLGTIRMDEVTVAHPKLAIHALSIKKKGAGISLESGPLSLALFSFNDQWQDSLFVRYREVYEGTAFFARLKRDGTRCGVDVEVSFSERRSCSATTSTWVGAGPLRLVERFGPSPGEREMEARLDMAHHRLSASLSLTTALGCEAIYSGEFQEKRTAIKSELRVPLFTFMVHLSLETSLALSSAGEETRNQVVALSLMKGRWHLVLRQRIGEGTALSAGDGSSTVSLTGGRISASFVTREGPWTFTLQFGGKGTFSLLWRYTATIDRGSGSPR